MGLVDSILRHYPDSKLYVAPLDDYSLRIFESRYKDVPAVIIEDGRIRKEFEQKNRDSGKAAESIFSLKPKLIENAIATEPADYYIYCDSDVFAFRKFDFHSVDADIILSEHFFCKNLEGYAKYGKFNAGIIGFSRTPDSIKCLLWWKKKCDESTAIDPSQGIVGDQKYLEEFPNIADSTRVLKLKTFNQSIWTFESDTKISNGPSIDNSGVFFYHFHRVRFFRFIVTTGINQYGNRFDRKKVFEEIYVPYFKQIAVNKGLVMPMLKRLPKIRRNMLKRYEWNYFSAR